MYAWKNGVEIVIWGSGYRGRQLYYRYRHKYKVAYFVDNYADGIIIDGVFVLKPSEIDLSKYRILIAIDKGSSEVCEQCQNMGLVFYQNFLPYEFFEYHEISIITLYKLVRGGVETQDALDFLLKEKKPVLLIGNCQIEYIQKMLLGSRTFADSYIFIKISPIFLLTEEDNAILEQCKFIFKRCELCITHPIMPTNRYSELLVTENVKHMLGKDARLLGIPVLYFDIYFPQTINQERRVDDVLLGKRLFFSLMGTVFWTSWRISIRWMKLLKL